MIEYAITFKDKSGINEEFSESKRVILDIAKENKESDVHQIFWKKYKTVDGEPVETWVEILYDKRMGINKGIKFKGK